MNMKAKVQYIGFKHQNQIRIMMNIIPYILYMKNSHICEGVIVVVIYFDYWHMTTWLLWYNGCKFQVMVILGDEIF